MQYVVWLCLMFPLNQIQNMRFWQECFRNDNMFFSLNSNRWQVISVCPITDNVYLEWLHRCKVLPQKLITILQGYTLKLYKYPDPLQLFNLFMNLVMSKQTSNFIQWILIHQYHYFQAQIFSDVARISPFKLASVSPTSFGHFLAF